MIIRPYLVITKKSVPLHPQNCQTMKYSVAQIAELISAEVVGNPNAEITTICKIEEGVPGGLTFLSNPKYTQYLYTTKATAAIVNTDFVPEHEVPCTLIKVANSYLAFAQLLNFYQQNKPRKTGVSDKACIAPTAKIGQNVYIGEFVSIGDSAEIGDGVSLYPQTVVGDRVKVGARTTLYAGVIGADGFGFAQQNGEYLKIPQVGNVEIGNHVEIGANTCIDRATMGSTRIHDHVKIDNLVQIAHNVTVGEGTAFAAQAGVAGSAKLGSRCIIAGQAGIAGHISIADGTVIGAQSGVSHSLKQGVYLGSPALPASEERKLMVLRRKLPELYQQYINNKKNQ